MVRGGVRALSSTLSWCLPGDRCDGVWVVGPYTKRRMWGRRPTLLCYLYPSGTFLLGIVDTVWKPPQLGG